MAKNKFSFKFTGESWEDPRVKMLTAHKPFTPSVAERDMNQYAETPPFNPEGDGYDYETASKYGITPDETGHWASRVPETGMLLKGTKHPTFSKALDGEKQAGYNVYKGSDGRYYSKQGHKPSDFLKANEANNSRIEALRNDLGGYEQTMSGQGEGAVNLTEMLESMPFIRSTMEPVKELSQKPNALGAISAILHGAMAPITAPFTEGTELLMKGGTVGNETANVVERLMNLPFDAIRTGSELTEKGLGLAGINLPKIGGKETDRQLNELATEIGGLLLLSKGHKAANEYVNKKAPMLKQIFEAPEASVRQEIQPDIKQEITPDIQPQFRIRPEKTVPLEGLTQEGSPISLLQKIIEGEQNAEAIRSDKGIPVKEGKIIKESKENRSQDLQRQESGQSGTSEIRQEIDVFGIPILRLFNFTFNRLRLFR